MIYGLRASLLVSTSAVLGSLALAVPLGLLAGYFGRWVDSGISRVLDLLLVFPALLLAITFIAILGPGSVIAAIAIAVIYLPILARVMRTSTLIVSRNDYVAGSRARGASHLQVMVSHVAPNAIGPVVVRHLFSARSHCSSRRALASSDSERSRQRLRWAACWPMAARC